MQILIFLSTSLIVAGCYNDSKISRSGKDRPGRGQEDAPAGKEDKDGTAEQQKPPAGPEAPTTPAASCDGADTVATLVACLKEAAAALDQTITTNAGRIDAATKDKFAQAMAGIDSAIADLEAVDLSVTGNANNALALMEIGTIQVKCAAIKFALAASFTQIDTALRDELFAKTTAIEALLERLKKKLPLVP